MVNRDISIIICAYSEERWDDLVAAVASLRALRVAPADIVVVIDYNEKLLTRARAQLHGVMVIPNVQTRGLSGARNSGIAVARGAFVAFLDDDARAGPDWTERLLAPYADPHVLGVGGSIEPLWEAGRPGWFPQEFDWVVGCTYRGHRAQTGTVRNLIGANMSFRASVFAHVGGFRDGVGQVGASMLRCDDTEFCIRVRQMLPAAMLLHEPRAVVYHHVPLSRARWRYFCSRCYTEGMAKALVAHLVGPGDALSTERVYVLRALPRAIARGFVDTARRGDFHGIARSATVVAGFGLTAAGYLVASLVAQSVRGRRRAMVGGPS